jgi:hypothetical protein
MSDMYPRPLRPLPPYQLPVPHQGPRPVRRAIEAGPPLDPNGEIERQEVLEELVRTGWYPREILDPGPQMPEYQENYAPPPPQGYPRRMPDFVRPPQDRRSEQQWIPRPPEPRSAPPGAVRSEGIRNSRLLRPRQWSLKKWQKVGLVIGAVSLTATSVSMAFEKPREVMSVAIRTGSSAIKYVGGLVAEQRRQDALPKPYESSGLPSLTDPNTLVPGLYTFEYDPDGSHQDGSKNIIHVIPHANPDNYAKVFGKSATPLPFEVFYNKLRESSDTRISQASCTDAANMASTAINNSFVFMPPNSGLNAAKLKNSENAYLVQPNGAMPDNPKIPNTYVSFTDVSGKEQIINKCGQIAAKKATK